MRLRPFIILAAVCCSWGSASAGITLPAVFSDHMVLQRDLPLRVWGQADPGESVHCQIESHSATAVAGSDGRWSLELEPMPAGGPWTVTVQGDGDPVVLKDVYIGEVWLCSGQSNMVWPVSRSADADRETSAANHPLIRMFHVKSGHAQQPQHDCAGSWSVCGPQTVGQFSATAYFFGRWLHSRLDVPIGLLNSSVGGTPIESWTSLSAQQDNFAIKPVLTKWQADADAFRQDDADQAFEVAMQKWSVRAEAAKAAGRRPPRKPRRAASPRLSNGYPGALFNGKINPLAGYGIRGAIWYQGERNTRSGFPQLYGDQLKTLIGDWRQRWGQGDFPFAWVQLPNYMKRQTQPSETSGWVLVQEAMLKTLHQVERSGMAVTIDVGEASDIHPKNKQAVGKRLARWALNDVYDVDWGDAMGPIYRQFTSQVVNGERRTTVAFQHADTGLVVADGEDLRGFAVAGEDRVFHWATARLEGDVVVLTCDEVPSPIAVRYSWASNPIGNLFNKSGIPASPFRTDDWDESP